MGLGIRVEKPFDMTRCGCEMTGRGQGKASDSDVAAKAFRNVIKVGQRDEKTND